jgi:hypothetical protein
MNIEKYVEMYKRDLYLKNYCTNSVNNYSSHIHSFLSHFNNTHISDKTISKIKSPINNIKL